MEYVIIYNGLGNQMSQYAFYLSKKSNNSKVKYLTQTSNKHNGYELYRLFGIEPTSSLFDKIINWLFFHILRYKKIQKLLSSFYQVIQEPINYNFDKEYLKKNTKKLVFYLGGWHSEKYFEDKKNDIVDLYHFPATTNNAPYLMVRDSIRSKLNSVSLHVRRGDFLNISPNDPYQFGGVATDEYYKKAVDYINKNVETPYYFIFSNDPDWCQNNLKIPNSTIVTCNTGINSWRDMELMTECKHHIIANSSFSWWGAWLAKNEGLTIRPKYFIRNINSINIYPNSWLNIEDLH